MRMNGGARREPGRVVSIVAGGWSVKAVDLARIPGTIIGVNESGVLLPRVDAIVSMDRLWTESRWPKVKARKVPFFARRSALQNVDWMGEDFVNMFDCDHTSVLFAESVAQLNGTNSGTCACALAYTMQPELLYLFGFDMCRNAKDEAYWHKPYEWSPKGATKEDKYKTWAHEFNDIALHFARINTRVINVSPDSRIHSFEKLSAEELGISA